MTWLMRLALVWILAASQAVADVSDLLEGPPDSGAVQRLVHFGEGQRSLGNILAAETAFQAAIQRAPTEIEQQYAATALGILWANEGLSQAKTTLLNQALGLERAFGAAPLTEPFQVVALAHVARLIADEPGRAADALDYSDRAVAAARLPLIRAMALQIRGEILLRTDRGSEALAALEQAEQALLGAQAGPARQGVQLTIAETALDDRARAGGFAELAARVLSGLTDTTDLRIRAEAHLLRAALVLRQGGSAAKALLHTSDALADAQATGSNRLLFRLARRRAELARDTGDVTLAARAYATAFGNLQLLRTKMFLGFDSTGTSIYRREAGGFHESYMDFLLTRPGTDLEAVINVAEDLKAIEMEEYFRAECRRSSTTINLAGSQAVFDRDTATLYPIVFNDRIEMLAIFGDQITRLPSARISQDRLRDLVRDARAVLEDPSKPFQAPLAALYREVFAAAGSFLNETGVQNVVYIPDGALRNVPLAALYDGEQFLVERYVISSTLGITLNVSNSDLQRERRFDARTSTALVAGAATTPEVPDLELTTVGEEVQDIADLFQAYANSGDPFANDAFSREKAPGILQSRPYDVIHIAAHAWFNGSNVRTSGGGGYIGLTDGSLSVGEFVDALLRRGTRYNRRIELVVLSACGTASDDTDLAPLGIAGAAYRANVATIVATLWSVYDVSANRITGKFYLNLLHKGQGRAEALANAQRWYLDELVPLWGDDGWRHPAFWAPFVLIGEPDYPRR